MYRQRHGRITPRDVVDFLVLDRDFPRAVLHCLVQADAALHRITGRPVGTFGDRAEQRLGRLHADLAFTRPDEVVAGRAARVPRRPAGPPQRRRGERAGDVLPAEFVNGIE